MSAATLNVSLAQYEIGLSGAIPKREDWSEPAMDRGILEFVALFTGIVLKYGGRIVHGCHPTFTPIILRQARLHATERLRKPLTLVMSGLWVNEYSEEDIQAMTDVAEFVVTKKVGEKDASDPDTRNQSLSAMRRVLIDAQNITVAVGGLLHNGDGIVPGVAEEVALAADKGVPRFLVGGLGGLTQRLAAAAAPAGLNNLLSEEANMLLFTTPDVTASVSVLFEHLALSRELATAAEQAVKWNPGNAAIIDHRDGTVDLRATGFILRAIAS